MRHSQKALKIIKNIGIILSIITVITIVPVAIIFSITNPSQSIVIITFFALTILIPLYLFVILPISILNIILMCVYSTSSANEQSLFPNRSAIIQGYFFNFLPILVALLLEIFMHFISSSYNFYINIF